MADERVINKILSEYENLRIAAANERKERIENVYKKFPEIKEIDAEINRLGFQNMNNILTHPEKKDE
ncbi:MAG: DNA replication protein DnaC, partial [Clostridia bacterium]|nr:DNA replication protein DnaC [Clostridia bacterium]